MLLFAAMVAAAGGGAAGAFISFARSDQHLERLPVSNPIHRVAITKTDSFGRDRLLRAVGSDRLWYASSSRARSGSVQKIVDARVSLSSSDRSPVPGERVSVRGQVLPSHAGERIELQQRGATAWRTVKSLRLNARSRFSTALRLRYPGRFAYRAALPAGARDARSFSPLMTLNVSAIHKIKHVVVIMQENRSFDQYFGTYPQADGIPGLAGNKGAEPCIPDPQKSRCDSPYHNRRDENFGGPHHAAAAAADMRCAHPARRAGCRMNGFAVTSEHGEACDSTKPLCSPCRVSASNVCPDVMGYHTGADIPNYWRYARDFVLQDHMFEPVRSWSLPEHLFMVSEWSAKCVVGNNPFSCTNTLGHPPPGSRYAWTDITYLLHRFGVSWAYYVFKGREPDCEVDSQVICKPVQQGPQTPGIWNPLPSFTDVVHDGQTKNVRSLNAFFRAAKAGRLPAVSWIVPNDYVSEHPPSLVSAGQTYVTGLLNAIMQSPDWRSTAIFLSWDDWGGFYDHVVPPKIDTNGYGLRVPGLVISAYARRGYIDHQTLSFDAYNRFIEDDFLGGRRLDPRTDARPDPRPDVRESNASLRNLQRDFNFEQRPRRPVILPVCPVTDLKPTPTC